MADLDDEELAPSKSARKREMLARQSLGEQLVALSPQQLAKLPIDNAQLLTTIAETRRIRSHSARRRHLQLIGKLMRHVDPEPIATALAALHAPAREQNARFHALEALREQMLEAGTEGADLALRQYPDADRQQLRALLRQHAKEQKLGQPPAASRKLFRYLRELQQQSQQD